MGGENIRIRILGKCSLRGEWKKGNEMKKFSINLYKLLYYIIALLPLLWVKNINILGDNALPLLLIVFEVGIVCKKILDNKIRIIDIKRKYSVDQCVCGFIFLFSLWKILSFLTGMFTKDMPDMEFYTTFLVAMGIYLLTDRQMEMNSRFLKVLTICGTLGSSIILLTDIKGINIKTIIDALTESSDGIYAYLLLAVMISILNYILVEEHGKWTLLWLAPIALDMLVLLLHHNSISNWIVVFALLLIASFFRPRATLIKKIGILLFLFLFLWANISLVLNYVKPFEVESTYSIEAGVYMELILTLGGIFFFYFWDRLPQEVDLHKVSMIRMQRHFRMITGVLGFVFFIFIAGGESWQSLPDNGLQGFVKGLALPLSKELVAGSSTIFTWIVEMGLMMVVLFLIWFYQIGKRLFERCERDREENNIFFLIYILFLIEIFIWEVPCNVFIAYMFLISMGNVQPRKEWYD